MKQEKLFELAQRPVEPQDFKKGKGRLLMDAHDGMPIGKKIERQMRDGIGMFALVYSTPPIVLVARSKVYGNLVSCHKRAAYAARNTGKKLVMYIEDACAYYIFDPEEVISNFVVANQRAEEDMLNFKIDLGKRYLS